MKLAAQEDVVSFNAMRRGFAVLALAIGLLCLAHATILALPFDEEGLVQTLRAQPFWMWLVDAPITWGSLLGSYLIWVACSETPWRRWAGLLVLMNAVDAALWTISRSDELGLPWSALGQRHHWSIFLVAAGLGWCELTILAGLALKLLVDAGLTKAPVPPGKPHSAVPGVASIGLVVWALFVVTQTDWTTWLPRPLLGPAYPLLLLSSAALYTLASFLVTVQCLTVSRYCRKQAQVVARSGELGEDLISLPSETKGPDHPERS